MKTSLTAMAPLLAVKLLRSLAREPCHGTAVAAQPSRPQHARVRRCSDEQDKQIGAACDPQLSDAGLLGVHFSARPEPWGGSKAAGPTWRAPASICVPRRWWRANARARQRRSVSKSSRRSNLPGSTCAWVLALLLWTTAALLAVGELLPTLMLNSGRSKKL
jgi:hypothetical protein